MPAVAPLGWLVFVELPVEEAYAPLYDSVKRSGRAAARGAAARGARRHVPRPPHGGADPGAAGGRRAHRAAATSRSASRSRPATSSRRWPTSSTTWPGSSRRSYADLERKVERRTQELARSVQELQALGEVSQAVNSTLDLETVLATIVAKAVQLSGTDAGAIYVFSKLRQTVPAARDLRHERGADRGDRRPDDRPGRDSDRQAAAQRREPLQVPDLLDEPRIAVQDLMLQAGYRALLVVPLLRPDRIVGALVVRRREPGLFPKSTIDLLQTFAAQSVLAIQNARLFSEIEEKGRELEIASQHKSQFLANMSHELRTPLNAVLGFTEMLPDGLYGPLPEKAMKALERVQANGKHLLGLINDVLDLSKIEAGQLTLALDDYSVGQVVQTVDRAPSRSPGRRASCSPPRCGRPADRPRRRAPADAGPAQPRRQRHQVHRKGSVEISARTADGCFEIAVRDTGPGIAPEDQSDLRGVPAGRQQQHAPEGRHRAWPRDLEAHRRDARRHDRGPVRARRGLDVPRRGAGAGRGAEGGGMTQRILMVEDTEDNRQIVRDLMDSVGYELIEAHDGAAGVAMATEHRPDLILMDIQLPVMDGYEVTRRIKADPALRHIPIIAVTSYALSGDEAKTRAAGCDGYVAKPFSPRQLLAKINRFLP